MIDVTTYLGKFCRARKRVDSVCFITKLGQFCKSEKRERKKSI